jgi:hypothetical protein
VARAAGGENGLLADLDVVVVVSFTSTVRHAVEKKRSPMDLNFPSISGEGGG